MYVMGEAATERAATDEEIERMSAIVCEAMQAGAVGFATLRASTHVAYDGRLVPSRVCDVEEIFALARAMSAAGGGLLEATAGRGLFLDAYAELAKIPGCTVSWTALLAGLALGKGDHVEQLAKSEEMVAAGLRVRPETLCRITEFSEHESNGRELDEGERVAVEVLPVLGQSAAAVEPGDGAFDHPTPGLDDEALHPIGSLDDLGLEIGQDAGQGAVKDRALIGAVGEQFPEKGKQTEQGRQQRETAVAILNVGGGDDAVQQQALRIDQNMPLLALDQLAGIEAVAVDASPPFSALFTL